MADYIISKTQISNDEVHNPEDIDPITKEDMELINEDSDDDKDVHFYIEGNKKLLLNNLEEEAPVPVRCS